MLFKNSLSSRRTIVKSERFLILLLVVFALPISVALASGSPTPQTLPNWYKGTPTPTAPTTGILFQDDFSDPSTGWEVGDYNGGSVGYNSGVYAVISSLESSFMWGIANQNFTDIQLDVDTTQITGPADNNNGYGVMCRVQPNGDGYMLLISADGFASIQVIQDGSPTALVDWTQTTAVVQGNSLNHLQAVCSESTMQLYVNSELAVETEDTSFTSGDIAFVVASLEAEPSEVDFDNLVVTAPGAATTTTDTTSQAGIIFQDDFSDPSTGWEVGDYDGGSVGYGDGDYVVTSTVQNTFMWGVANQNFADADIEFDAAQVTGPANNNNGYGVMCRTQEDGSGYMLRISGDGYASIYLFNAGEATPLVDWAETSAVNQGNASNHLRAVCSGSTFQLYINDELAAEGTDTTFTDGDLAFTVSSYETDPSEVHFDNLVVAGPGGAEQTGLSGLSGLGSNATPTATNNGGKSLGAGFH
jgi:hypothetical protein